MSARPGPPPHPPGPLPSARWVVFITLRCLAWMGLTRLRGGMKKGHCSPAAAVRADLFLGGSG